VKRETESAAAPVLAHPEALSPPARAAVAALAARDWAGDAYLAGSAALALHLGHRPVSDLDLMTGTNRLGGPERRDLLADLKALDPGCRVETARDGYLFARLASGVALKLFHYPYPLIDPVEELDGLAVASAVDLGLMKLAAIISRGGRRDFVDLHLLCRRLPLAELLLRAPEKFGHVGDFALQALKALADRSEVAGEPLPRLARPLEWKDVESWADAEVDRLGRPHVGLAE
jgi:nucleotidyltransferase AbiEii toxin of type IV toxin-antitoxin system